MRLLSRSTSIVALLLLAAVSAPAQTTTQPTDSAAVQVHNDSWCEVSIRIEQQGTLLKRLTLPALDHTTVLISSAILASEALDVKITPVASCGARYTLTLESLKHGDAVQVQVNKERQFSTIARYTPTP